MKKLKKITDDESRYLWQQPMPKDMSDWIDNAVNWGHAKRVKVKDYEGVAMKSRDSTVIFFPHNNCAEQFKDIVNKLR